MEKWLHEQRLSYAAAGELFGCSGEYVRLIALGLRPAVGVIGERIIAVLTGLKTVDDLRATAVPPRRRPVPPAASGIGRRSLVPVARPDGAASGTLSE